MSFFFFCSLSSTLFFISCFLPFLLYSQTGPDSGGQSFVVYDYFPFPYGSTKIYMTYPMGCIKTFFGLDSYVFVQCIYADNGNPYGIRLTKCGSNSDCIPCSGLVIQWDVDPITNYTFGLTAPLVGYCSVNLNEKFNYIQTKIYHATSIFDSGCLSKYAYSNNTLTFATGICHVTNVPSIWRMTECTPEASQAATYIYTDNACTLGKTLEFYSFDFNNKNGSYYASYEVACELLYQPSVLFAEWIYQRLDVCYGDGSVLTFSPSITPTLMPTMVPTFLPTNNPNTPKPSVNPTTPNPTVEPTIAPVPTTSGPTEIPTFIPTEIPTFMPTEIPSMNPTMEPTAHPTLTPTVYRGIHVGSIPISQMNLIYISFGVILVFYIFICLYVWGNERRKRKNLISNYQRGLDKVERQKWLRQRSQQQQNIQMEQQFQEKNHQPVNNNDFNVQMIEGGR